jgi:hypothetical protein
MTNIGIDYGLGKTNIDFDTGIRFGVIHTNNLFEWFWEALESDYGEPHCPHCGDVVKESCSKDYFCHHCIVAYWSEDCYPESPVCQYIDDGEYKAILDDYGDVFIEKAPYYTKAQFCSPCAPGACYLTNPTPDGDKAYCFGHDWFDDNKAPYPVYCVKTGKEVKPE